MRFSLLCILLLVNDPVPCPGQGWVLKRDKKDITIWVREQADSLLKEYKARALISHPIQTVFDFLADVERHPQWVYRCSGLTIIENGGEDHVKYHTSYDIPWPRKDRDLTAETRFIRHEGGEKIEIITRNVNVDYPLEEDVVRMPRYREWVILEKMDTHSTVFKSEGFTDPGGNAPTRLVNMFLVDGVYHSVMKIRELLDDQAD